MISIPSPVRDALERLHRSGYEAYIVGGCVRDSLLGRQPGDWDLCTSALPEETKSVFSSFRTLDVGIRHGTVTVLSDGMNLEITTFRTDGAYLDGRHPESVAFTPSLREDLARRDFTCNAMAYSDETGVIDPFGGREDLRCGLLRCVGNPVQRFREDALRILRALRFAARYGFTVEEETAAALHSERELLRLISPERCFSELKGILCAEHAVPVLRQFSDVLFVVIPELAVQKDYNQNLPHHTLTLWEHTLADLDASPRDEILRLTMLLHDVGKPASRVELPERASYPLHGERGAGIADLILRRFRCDNATRLAVTKLVELHDYDPPQTRPEIRREIAQLGTEQAERLAQVRLADAIGHCSARTEIDRPLCENTIRLQEEILAEGGCFSLRELAVNGEELVSLGAERGAALGKLLNRLFNAVLDEKLPNEREALLSQAKVWLSERE